MVKDDVLCFFTEGSTSRDAAQHEHRGAVRAFWGSSEAEKPTEHTTSRTVLDRDGEPVAPDLVTLEELLQAKRENRFCLEGLESVGDPEPCFYYD